MLVLAFIFANVFLVLRDLQKLLFPELLLLAVEIVEEELLFVRGFGLPKVVVIFRDISAAHLPNLVGYTRRVLRVVFPDGSFVAPSEDLLHAGVHVAVPRFDAEDCVVLGLQRAQELDP